MRQGEPDAAAAAQTRWLMSLRRQGGRVLIVALLLPLLGGLLLIAQAATLAGLLHRAIVAGAGVDALLPSIAVLAGLIGARLLLGLLGEQAAIAASERIKLAVRTALGEALLRRRPDWTAARSSGALAATVIDQVDALDGFFARFLPAMLQASLLPLAFIAAVMPVDWIAGLLFLVSAPLIPVFMALIGWGAEAATRSQATAFARLSGLFADRLRGLTALKLLGRADQETRTVVDASDRLRRRTLVVLRIAFLSSAVLEFFAALGVAGVALYIGLSYLGYLNFHEVRLTLEGGLFCLLMAPEVYQPLRLLAAHYHDRAAAKSAVAEIATRLGALPELPARPARSTMAHAPRAAARGRRPPLAIELRALSMSTPGAGRPVLDTVSATFEAGTQVAILGESGIGKSTLLEGIAGLRDFAGAIEIGGRPLAEIPETQLRADIAFLGQRPRIFHSSIAENIRFGRAEASDAEVYQAAQRAEVTRFAAELLDGLDTVVGEGGLGLSGGEAHRVALARIFLRDPAILLLDEPTAHLDAATERTVLDAILAFAAGHTLIVATHSAAVAARMERSYRIAAGKLLPSPHARRMPAPAAGEGTA